MSHWHSQGSQELTAVYRFLAFQSIAQPKALDCCRAWRIVFHGLQWEHRVMSGGLIEAPGREELERKLAETTALLEQREGEMAELQHRSSNSLALVSSFLNLQRRQLTDETATVALTDAAARIEAIARLYRTMREQSAASRIDFGQYLTTLGAEMSASTGLHCNVQTEPIASTARQQ
jgi:hypothetical protein